MTPETLTQQRTAYRATYARMEFLRGVTSVLGQLTSGGDCGSTLYNEIVRAHGREALIDQARRDGAMRWSGLAQYERDRKKWGQP